MLSLGLTAQKLREMHVETIAIVATPVDRARRYFRYRRPRCLIGADAELATHRAFGVPRMGFTEELGEVVAVRVDGLARQEGLEVAPGAGWEALDRVDGIDRSEHMPDLERHQAQLIAQFLVDRDGVIRWSNVECERDGLAGLDRFPSDDELLAAAGSL